MKGILASWLGSLGVGLSTALVGAWLALWIATRAVDWYQVSSREGASGYFVIFQGIFAFIGGLVIGIIISRVVIGSGGSQLKALLFAVPAHLLLIAAIGGIARLRADVPPKFEGERLLLAVEVSWPEAQAPSLTPDSLPHISLSSMSGNVLRTSERGPLWLEDARREAGRVIVPAAVEIFTSRGKRMLRVHAHADSNEMGLLLPLPAYPGKSEREWSVWMPRAREGAPALPDGVRYRFRIVKRSEPIRRQTVGPFTIETIAKQLMVNTYGALPPMHEAEAEFALQYRGAPIVVELRARELYRPDPWKENEAPPADAPVRFTRFVSATVVPGATPALVVEAERTDDQFRYSYLVLVQADGDRTKSTFIAPATLGKPHRLTASANDTSPNALLLPKGYVDFQTLAEPGLYLYHRALLDTRVMSVRALPADPSLVEAEPTPLSLSPDEKHMARLRSSDDTGLVVEQVTIETNAKRSVPVGDERTATGQWSDADQRWFSHYFSWEATATGAFELRKKPGVQALPFRGRMMESSGYREYRVSPVHESLRDAIIAEFVQSFGATLLPTDSGAFSKEIKLGGDIINLGYSSDDDHVSFWLSAPANTEPIIKLARHVDSVLATRRWDSHFIKANPIP